MPRPRMRRESAHFTAWAAARPFFLEGAALSAPLHLVAAGPLFPPRVLDPEGFHRLPALVGVMHAEGVVVLVLDDRLHGDLERLTLHVFRLAGVRPRLCILVVGALVEEEIGRHGIHPRPDVLLLLRVVADHA